MCSFPNRQTLTLRPKSIIGICIRMIGVEHTSHKVEAPLHISNLILAACIFISDSTHIQCKYGGFHPLPDIPPIAMIHHKEQG